MRVILENDWDLSIFLQSENELDVIKKWGKLTEKVSRESWTNLACVLTLQLNNWLKCNEWVSTNIKTAIVDTDIAKIELSPRWIKQLWLWWNWTASTTVLGHKHIRIVWPFEHKMHNPFTE